MRTPQRDVPTEKIIHYIVKDYQRMYNGFHAMRESKDTRIDELLKKISRKQATIAALQDENKRLRLQVNEVQASRNAVVREVTADLEERLKEANRKVNLLIQALQDPQAIYEINSHTLTTDDDREWMGKAMKQLEKAEYNFTSISARLTECEAALLGVTDSIEKRGILSKINKAFSKIDSCVNHIEEFFKKVGNIKNENDGQKC